MLNKTVCYYLDASELCDLNMYNLALGQIIWQERLDAIDRYRFAGDKRLSLGAGLLLKYALGLAGVQDMSLEYGKHGKPALASKSEGVFFNCSHSGSIVACAVSDCRVGVDVEKTDAVDKRVIKKVFSQKEQEWIGDDEERFFRLWTRKESYLKLLGDGMTVPLKSVCVLDDDCASGAGFTELALDGYKLAVCSSSRPEFVRVLVSEILNEGVS